MIQINATRCNVSNCEILQNSNTIYGNLHRTTTTTTTTWDTNDGYANKQQQRMKKKISRLSSGIKATIPTMMILLVLSFGQMVTGASRDHELLLREERAELVHQWAPFVWLHPNEHFYPSSVIHFLQHAKPSTPGRGNFLTINEGNSQIILPSLPRGRSSWDTYLLASYNTECHNCHLPKFLYGQKPGRKHLPPTYAVIHSCTFRDHMRRDSTNSENNPQEFLNNDNNTGHPSSFNTKRAPVSLLDKNQSHNLENGTTEATTILASRMPTSTTTSHNIHKNHQWNPLIRLQHNKDHSNYSQEKKQVLNSNNMQINNSSTVNVSLRQNLTKRNKNTHKITSTVSEATLMTTLAPQLRQTVKNEANNTSQLMDNMIDNSEILHAVNIQNDQDIYTQQKATSNFSNENTYETYSKDKKRDVVYDSNQLFAVTYWMFYPYNYAKEMCTANLGFFGRILKPTIHGVCHGEKIAMGNHVGDWEHITIQFKGRTPTKLYISSHNFGAYYIYHPHHQVFYYASQDTRKGIPLSPNYPPFLELDGTHPILYSALGSHGLWPTSGIHQYNNFPALEDTTGQGTAWHTWQNLEIIDLKYQNIFTPLQRHWLFYEGRWGNPSSKCYTLMGGFCENNHGPTGIPRKRINFPCPR